MATSALSKHDGIAIHAPLLPGFDAVLSDEALAFIAELARRYTPRVDALLAARVQRQARFDGGELPDFLTATREIRDSEWRVTDIPADLLDRRVEITGPADRKMIINALNSGAKVFMADLEDSMAPTWNNVIDGQINLRDAVNGTISLTTDAGKHYEVGAKPATLIVRPRGWHLPEKHIELDGKPVPGALIDFGLFFFHNAANALQRGTGPYFYLPKLEAHEEAALWADVFSFSEQYVGIPPESIKVTVLIETLTAAFEMDEILHALRDYIVGLNCGRWDYIFSFIKKFRNHPDFVLPDRGEVTMARHFLRSYSQLLIKTCHRRGAFAMGGMAAQIPIKSDSAANEIALGKVRADKELEAKNGHDGTWVAHPGLVPIAMEIFDRHLDGPNQLDQMRTDVEIAAADLIKVPAGQITDTGLRANISIAVQYMAAWLNGNGCVPLNHLMEDAATAEISRAQIWQWIRHDTAVLADSTPIDLALFEKLLPEELARLRSEFGEQRYFAGGYEAAGRLLDKITRDEEFVDFLTLAAYEQFD